jgi:hypothetical protein
MKIAISQQIWSKFCLHVHIAPFRPAANAAIIAIVTCSGILSTLKLSKLPKIKQQTLLFSTLLEIEQFSCGGWQQFGKINKLGVSIDPRTFAQR